jgi:hypothetical protein
VHRNIFIATHQNQCYMELMALPKASFPGQPLHTGASWLAEGCHSFPASALVIKGMIVMSAVETQTKSKPKVAPAPAANVFEMPKFDMPKFEMPTAFR